MVMLLAPELQAAKDLIDDMGQLATDPFAFVMYAYPWGEGILSGYDGPDTWQETFLKQLAMEIKKRGFNPNIPSPVMPIRMNTTSGHGIGKSALTSWLVDFLMSTRANCRGTVTANTAPQLKTKTWAEICKWTNLCITRDWFEIHSGQNMVMRHKDYPDTWFCSAQTCKETNSEAFAGQHEAKSTSFYIFDESSNVPNKIHEVAEGGLTDGEPMIFKFGNPTRNSGWFYDEFHSLKDKGGRFCMAIDSRTSKITNKDFLQEQIDTHGIESDFVKVRVLGKFPTHGMHQLISLDTVLEAERKTYREDDITYAMKLLGVDVAWEGDDYHTIYLRQGLLAQRIGKYQHLPHETMTLADIVANIIRVHNIDYAVIDSVGVGAGVVDRLRQLGFGKKVIAVNPCNKARDETKFSDVITEAWWGMRDWLYAGGAIPRDKALSKDLTTREYSYDKQGRVKLESKKEMKKRGMDSPDDGDGLGLTFAVNPQGKRKENNARKGRAKMSGLIYQLQRG